MSGNNELVEVNELINHILAHAKGKLKWKIETLPSEFLEKSAEELENMQNITDTDSKLRILFHQELERASEANETMIMANVCKGVCHASSWALKLDDPKKLAWILLPYQHETVRIKHQVTKAHDTMEDILSIDMYYKDPETGERRIDYKAAELRWKAAKVIYDRAYPATQNIKYVKGDDNKKEDKISIEEQIKLLEAKIGNNG